jgi:predicted nucleic acid-binding protein
MPFVVDASIAVAWALKETHAKASVALTRVRTEGGGDLALRESLPLATLDKELATAARAEGVALIGDDTDR